MKGEVHAGRRRRDHLWALVGYLLAALVFTWPLAVNFSTAIPGDSFDGWQNYWNLWWTRTALIERAVSPLFTDLLYAPTGVSLLFHTLNLSNSLLTMPVQLTFGLIAAYNTVVLLSWVLAGYGMFLLARWVVGAPLAGLTFPFTAASTPAAPPPTARRRWLFLAPFFAGLVYTLAPFHMAHLLGHMQVFSLEWLPFYVLLLLRSLDRSLRGASWLRSALAAGLFLVLAGLSDWYFVLYLLLFTLLTLLWMLARGGWQLLRSPAPAGGRGRAASRLAWRTLAPPLAAGLVFAALLGFWLAPMIGEAATLHFMVRPAADLYLYSAAAADFLLPNRLQTLWRDQSSGWIGNQVAPISERTIQIGYVALALAITALAAVRRRAVFWWIAAVFFFLLALGPQLHLLTITPGDIPAAAPAGQELPSWTLYGILNRIVPFMRISRSVSRFALMVQFCIGVLAALGLAWLLDWLSARLRADGSARPRQGLAYTAWAVLTVLLLAEYWVAPYPSSPPDTPAYYTQLAADPDGRAVLNLPMNYDRPGYLLYQTVHGKPLTVAYISREDPRTLTERVPLLQQLRHLGPDIIDADLPTVGPTVLADLGVGTVVLDRYKMPGGREREYTEQVAQALWGAAAPLFADERITVYRMAPPAQREPYLRLGPLNWGDLQTDAAGRPLRTLAGAAAIEPQHVAAGARIAVTYRTDAGAPITLLSPDRTKAIGRLEAAPQGATVTLALDDLARAAGVADAGGLPMIWFLPTAPGTAQIEELALR